MNDLLVGGLDLAAKESRCSGLAVIKVGKVPILMLLKCLHSDGEIVRYITELGIKVLAIDAPLTNKPLMRDVDRLMIRAGFRVFPPSFSWMKQLTLRAYRLVTTLKGLSIRVIETHPRSALMSSGFNDVTALCEYLGINIGGFKDLIRINKDLRDALISAVVAYCFVSGCAVSIRGVDGEVYLIKKIIS